MFLFCVQTRPRSPVSLSVACLLVERIRAFLLWIKPVYRDGKVMACAPACALACLRALLSACWRRSLLLCAGDWCSDCCHSCCGLQTTAAYVEKFAALHNRVRKTQLCKSVVVFVLTFHICVSTRCSVTTLTRLIRG